MKLNGYAAIFLYILCQTVSFNYCQRRLKDGRYPRDDKRYMAYFVNSNFSHTSYNTWFCSGAIISTTKILTAASCLVELNNMYAIAGYKFYVNGMYIDTDECTRRWKQRVVKVCIHEDNSLNHSRPAGSPSLNIGVATVETPYDFNDLTYRLHCSHVPAPIAISYQLKDLQPGNNVMMFGWENSDIRETKDSMDRNSHYLQAAVSKIQDKKKCLNDYRNMKGVAELINNTTICVTSRGSIDVNGDIVTETPPANTRCSYRRGMNGTQSVKCNEDDFFSDYGLDFDYDFRKNNKLNSMNRNNTTITRRRKMGLSNIHTNVISNVNRTRRQAICQNEHGSPLVTWVGIAEMAIGVALTREYISSDLCVEPSIFYSTYAAKDWLTCVLAADDITIKLCAKEEATLRGYNVKDTQVNWDKGVNSHDEANVTPKEDSFETVDVQLRPQISIHSIES